MESYKELFDSYFIEVNNLTDLLTKYVNSYRLLIGGAGELNGIALARKKEVRDAIRRANQLGQIIDVLLNVIQSVECCYLDYIRIKADVIAVKTAQKAMILTEIDNELLFQNSTLGPAGNQIQNEKAFPNRPPQTRKKRKHHKKGEDDEEDEDRDNDQDCDNDDEHSDEHDDNHNDDQHDEHHEENKNRNAYDNGCECEEYDFDEFEEHEHHHHHHNDDIDDDE